MVLLSPDDSAGCPVVSGTDWVGQRAASSVVSLRGDAELFAIDAPSITVLVVSVAGLMGQGMKRAALRAISIRGNADFLEGYIIRALPLSVRMVWLHCLIG